jgi:hypothetical protein
MGKTDPPSLSSRLLTLSHGHFVTCCHVCRCAQRCHARTTGMSSQRVVYCGVRRSCFIHHSRRSPASPVLASSTGPRT